MGVRLLMSEVTLQARVVGLGSINSMYYVQGYLAHKKTSTPLGPPQDPRHRPSLGS
jgi:hypothetical protein